MGSSLSEALIQNGHSVTVLTRRAPLSTELPDGVFPIIGNPMEPGEWQDHVAKSDVVINLAGALIFQRWNEKNKRMIRNSRILSTQNIVTALSQHRAKRLDLINASAVGYYGHRGDELIDESESPGADFLASVCQEWEAFKENVEIRTHGELQLEL